MQTCERERARAKSAWIVGGMLFVGFLYASPARAEKITLGEALKRAGENNPELQAAGADLEIGEGVLLGAHKYQYNPELAARLGPSFSGSETLFEYEVGLSQTVELGGKRGNRIDAAQARRGAADARLRWARLVTAARARRVFFLAIVARSRLETARDAEAVAAQLKSAAVERRSLGAGTRLEVNVGTAAVGRAQAERMAAERRYRQARLELASAIGAPADADLEPDGQVPSFAPPTVDENAFIARALQREDLAAARLEREGAASDVAFADALAVPDVSLGVIYARDAVDRANAALVGISLPIPLLNRNQGGRAAARGALKRTTIAVDAVRRQAEREARAAFRNFTLARDGVLGFDRDVVEKLGENLGLARESFRAGNISLLEFNIVRRDLVDTRVAYLEALNQLIDAWFALEVTGGGAPGGSP